MKSYTVDIEKGDNNKLWGRVKYRGDLIVTIGKNEEEVLSSLENLIFENHSPRAPFVLRLIKEKICNIDAYLESTR